MNHGLSIVPDGSKQSGIKEVWPPKSGEYDRDTIATLLEVIKSNSESTWPIAGDPEGLRDALSRAQQSMTIVYAWLDVQFDIWDRLDKMLRILYPDTGCIRGDECGGDMIVSCKACAKGFEVVCGNSISEIRLELTDGGIPNMRGILET